MNNKLLLILTALLLLLSCSPLLLEPVFVEEVGNEHMPPTTKSVQPETEEDADLFRHKVQTNHYLILMHHVQLCDSVYVQTLTQEDMRNLKITAEEQEFSRQYVVQLNELTRQK